ncbi:DNA phosphorothioation-associated protein 4 [Bacillus aerolatus]|uniref:DNA phosphorothioation-associated protein 4 n=1 Tax=Bacillus aerolatus TaxID=2653354 RepID=A0A6I1FK80_9BACI|nr:DNA phosphorothioation-associated protein 4 [Bacillus aerolatus]KAB7707126.1 DNA phosphorothioation-associated protein 4 [Bacillus aerolatus]
MASQRIRRPEEQEHIYKAMTDKKEFGIFDTYKDYFMLSLAVGFLEGKRKSFSKSLELIHWNVFNEDTDESLMNLITYLETHDFKVLYGTDQGLIKQKITIIEEYAAAGAEILYEKIMKDPTQTSEVLINYLLKFQDYKSTQVNEPSRLIERLSW